MFIKYILFVALSFVALADTASSQARPPAQKTGPITIFGEGSSGPASGFSVTGNGRTRTLGELAGIFSRWEPNVSFTNAQTGTRSGPGYSSIDSPIPLMITTKVTTPGTDIPEGQVMITKDVNYDSPTGPSSYLGSSALAVYANHRGNTRNNEAAVTGLMHTYNNQNGQPFGPASSVGVAGSDICMSQNCIAGWGGLFNRIEQNYQENMICCSYGAEVGIFAYGKDNFNSRRVLLLAAQQARKVGNQENDKPTEIGSGIQFSGSPSAAFKIGIDFIGGQRFLTSAIQLTATYLQDISWRNASNLYDAAGFVSGTRFSKGDDNTQYFDNFDGKDGNTVGFVFRQSAGFFAANVVEINNTGLNVAAGKLKAPGGTITSSVIHPNNGAGVVTSMFYRGVDPTVNEVPARTCVDWYNSTVFVLRRYCNIDGTLHYTSASN